MGYYENVCQMITEQQKGKEGTAPWMVGEQLKEIAKNEPLAAELLTRDLEIPEMSIVEAEKKIKARADAMHKGKKGNCVCVPPNVAEEILREFYGLPKAGAEPIKKADSGILNLADFM